MIPKTFIDRVVAAPENAIVDYISGQMELKKRKNIYYGECPFCGAKIFCVYPETNSFYCFCCRAGGDVITYVRKVDKMGYVDAIKKLAKHAHLEFPGDATENPTDALMRTAARYYHAQLIKEPRESKIWAAMKDWNITDEMVTKLGLGYARPGFRNLQKDLPTATVQQLFNAKLLRESKKGGYYDWMRDGLVIPTISTAGKVLGFDCYMLAEQPILLHFPKTERYDRHRELHSLNLAIKSGEKTVLVVEAYKDAWKLQSENHWNVVYCYLANLTAQQIDRLKRYFTKIVLLTHGARQYEKTMKICEEKKVECAVEVMS